MTPTDKSESVDFSKDAVTDLERKIADLQALNRLAQTIGSTMEVEKILEIILNESIELCSAEHGSILTVSAKSERPMQTVLKTAKFEAGDRLSHLSDLVCGWMLDSGESLLTDNIRKDHRFQQAGRWLQGLSSVLAIPMIVRGQKIGIIILTKPTKFSKDNLDLMTIVANQCGQFLENAQRYQQVCQQNLELQRQVERKYDFCGLIGESYEIRKVVELLRRIVPGESRVLIEGESGTGKELVANIIHHNGPRKAQNFIAVDCGALPESLLESELFGHVRGSFTGATSDKKGLFEIADHGTLFLDEISNTTLAFQAKLLRAIQEGEIKPVGATQARKVNVRVIAATSSDLKSKAEAGEFRKELYFRLNIIAVHLPPLRQRISDIRLLAEHFLQKLLSVVTPVKKLRGFTTDAMRYLEDYGWPGNIRELENTIERAVALALPEEELLSPELLPAHIVDKGLHKSIAFNEHNALSDGVADAERRIIIEILRKHQGNRTQTAQRLGVSRQTLLTKMKKYGLV
jgi:transcriptional regulator with GAF, ATPase, and Fis domain